MSPDNRIVMNWDCQRQGCFNLKKRLKFGVFKECLPGNISFSDVDGIVEVNGNLLFLEWKDHPCLNTGQRILFERLTRLCPATVLIVEGDAEQMTVDAIRTVWRGQIAPAEVDDIDGLRARIQQWSHWAMSNSAILQSQQPLEDIPVPTRSPA
jgi:hypothetical protein